MRKSDSSIVIIHSGYQCQVYIAATVGPRSLAWPSSARHANRSRRGAHPDDKIPPYGAVLQPERRAGISGPGVVLRCEVDLVGRVLAVVQDRRGAPAEFVSPRTSGAVAPAIDRRPAAADAACNQCQSAPPGQRLTCCRCDPSPSIPRVMTSPSARKTGGLRPLPTPGGVPVVMMSPGCNDMNWLT